VESDLHGSRNVEREGAFLPGTTRNCPEFSMHRLFVAALSATVLALSSGPGSAAAREPYGIALEGFAYPYPVQLLPLVNDGEQLRMAYMDIAPARPNGRTVVLLQAAISRRATGRRSSRH